MLASPGPSTGSGRSSTTARAGAPTEPGPSAGPGPTTGRSSTRLVRFATGLYRQTLVDPIEQGRLRDLQWPYGLRSIVLVGYIVFVIAGLLVIFSGLIREHSTLIVSGTSLGLPGTAGLATGPAALVRCCLAHGGGPAWALVAQGARPAVHAHGDGNVVAAQSVACRLGGLASDRCLSHDSVAGAGDHSMASRVRLVGIRRDMGA